MEFTGHYWEHEWPNCTLVPDNMAMAAWQQRPGIDILMNQYAEHTHAQLGNVRSCREIASIANQLGRPRTLVELYGAGGWDPRFEDMKRIADWLLVLGVNTLDEHLSYVTIRGARKNDHPPSFSYHTPWWPAYHVLAGYFSRLSAALSRGQQVHRILVLEPTTTAWMYQGDRARLEARGEAFMRLLLALEAAQIEYDLGSEDVIARWGSVTQGRLWVGQRGYDVIVLPPGMENVSGSVTDLGEEFLTTGGSIVCLGDPPARVDGRESSRPAEGAGEPGWITARPEEAPAQLRRWNDEEQFRLERATGDRSILFHHRRRLADGQLLFLVNTSIEHPSAGRFITVLRGVEEWDATTGWVRPYPFRAEVGKVTAEFALPPCGSLLLFLSEKPGKPAPFRAETTTRLEAVGPMEVCRLEPNVLKLDYVDITAGGQTRSNVYYYAAAQFAFQKNGLERNPWDHAVHFRDEIISRTFAADSGFTASYRFTIEGPVPTNLTLVIERPDLYTITVNGRPVAAPPVADAESARGAGRVVGRTVEFRDWWLDRAFGRMPIADVAQPGENVITLTARPFTVWHELEATFVLGHFMLKPVERGFVITADAPLGVASSGARRGWNEQGHPFYAGRVGYRQSFQVAKPTGRYVVTLPDWWGSVAAVRVNGQSAGYIISAPWECEVTRLVRAGINEVEVQVIGTLKNTLGLHHGKPPLGSAWPAMFRTGPENGPPPGASYHTVGYGLFAPVALKQIIPAAKSGR